MNKLPRFIFVHIIKTGGTTLREVIKKIYGSKYLLDRSWKRNKKSRIYVPETSKYPEDYKKFYVIHGHFTAKKYSHLKKWKMITFLRNPIERIISHFSSWSGNYKKDISIIEFAKIYANHMTYITGGNLDQFDFIGLTEYYDESIKQLQKTLSLKFPNQYPYKNKTPKKVKITKKQKRIIVDLNREDIALYEKVLRRYK
jgi:hypothetical protein